MNSLTIQADNSVLPSLLFNAMYNGILTQSLIHKYSKRTLNNEECVYLCRFLSAEFT